MIIHIYNTRTFIYITVNGANTIVAYKSSPKTWFYSGFSRRFLK